MALHSTHPVKDVMRVLPVLFVSVEIFPNSMEVEQSEDPILLKSQPEVLYVKLVMILIAPIILVRCEQLMMYRW